MSDNNSSANTAILAIFVVVLLAMLGFFIVRNDEPDKSFELKVDVPNIEQPAKPDNQ